MNGNIKLKTQTLEGLYKLRYHIPESWKRAAGLLSRKRKSLENHVRRVSLEWDRKK